MGDSRRFDLMAGLIQKQFPSFKDSLIADVAGGKGHLQQSLRERGYTDIVTFDKRKVRCRGRHHRQAYQLFSRRTPGKFGLIIGMHPDEATDVIIVEAARRRVPFAVCPCCVKPTASTLWGKKSYGVWVKHLIGLAKRAGFDVTEHLLKMNGKNAVLVGRPRK